MLEGNYEDQEKALVRVRDLVKALYRATDKMDQLLNDERASKEDIKQSAPLSMAVLSSCH